MAKMEKIEREIERERERERERKRGREVGEGLIEEGGGRQWRYFDQKKTIFFKVNLFK